MAIFYTDNCQKKDKIIKLFTEKKISYSYSEQITIFKNHSFGSKGETTIVKRYDNYVYFFEWKDKKVKKEHLMAL